jgi:inosine/xanthosine triphosphate pyrophosphatase family protein
VGTTDGHLSAVARGSRTFYWDTVFVPDDPSANPDSQTYAEIVEANGIEHKLKLFSQSAKAMLQLFAYLEKNKPILWPRASSK